MKNEQFKKYFYIGLTVFLALGASILLFFMLDKASQIKNIFSVIIQAAKPLIYGAVIAYLLYPACIFLEKCFRKIFKKLKNRKVANKLIRALSIIFSFIFGFGIVTVLLYLIIPQIYDSIVTIINSIPAYIEKVYVFVDNQLSGNAELKQSVTVAISKYTENITQLLQNWSGQIGSIVKAIGDGVLSVFAVTKNIFIGIILINAIL